MGTTEFEYPCKILAILAMSPAFATLITSPTGFQISDVTLGPNIAQRIVYSVQQKKIIDSLLLISHLHFEVVGNLHSLNNTSIPVQEERGIQVFMLLVLTLF